MSELWTEKKHFGDAVLARLDTGGVGLEVAPYFNPLVVRNTFDVRYVDYLSNEELQIKAKDNPGAVGRTIPAVDYVWKPGLALSSSIPDGQVFDYAVASHVLEHVPDPINWLNDILSVLRIGGVLAIILPDRRATGDILRPLTSESQMIGWWTERRAIPSPDQVFDFLSHSVQRRDGVRLTSASAVDPKLLTRSYSDEDAFNFAIWSHNEQQYLDIHCTVWEPDHFLKVINQLVNFGVLNVSVSSTIEQPYEFAVHLTKVGDPARVAPAKQMAKKTVEASAAPTQINNTDRLGVRAAFSQLISTLRARTIRS